MLPNNPLLLQNGTVYDIWLARDDGSRFYPLPNAGPFKYTSAVNNYGSFSLELPASFDRTLLSFDNRVLFWRKPITGPKYLDFEGIIRYRETTTDEAGNTIRVVQGPSLEYLLESRVIAYASGSAQADQSGVAADTLLATIVAQNLGSSATDSRRQLSSSIFTVQTAAGSGPTISKGMSYAKLMDTLREITSAARVAGTEVYFAMVPTGEKTFEFRTKVGQPGYDRTSGGPFFGMEYRNMIKPRLIENVMDEINFGYGLGQGQGINRNIQNAEDTTRSLRSVFGRREGKVNANSETTNAGVTAAAQALINNARPLNAFTAQLLSLPGCLYGVDWGFGDRLRISYDGRQFNALLRAVGISVNAQGKEDINPTLLEAYL